MMMILVMMIMMISLSLNISLSSLLFLSVHFLHSHRMMLKQTWNSKRKGWVEANKKKESKEELFCDYACSLYFLNGLGDDIITNQVFQSKAQLRIIRFAALPFFVTDFLATFCAVFLDRRYVSCKKVGWFVFTRGIAFLWAEFCICRALVFYISP